MTVLPFKSESPAALAAAEQADPLAELLERRKAIEGEIAPVSRVDQARAEVKARLAELDSEEAALEEAERLVMRERLNRPDGAPPSRKASEREDIARRRNLCANGWVFVLNAEQENFPPTFISNGERGVAARRAERVRELHEIDVQIFLHRVSEVVSEARRWETLMREATQTPIAAAVQIDGIKEGLRAAHIQSMKAKSAVRTGALGNALAELEKIRPAELMANPEARNYLASEHVARPLGDAG